MTTFDVLVWLNHAYIEWDNELVPSDYSVESTDAGVRVRWKAREIEDAVEAVNEYTLAECVMAIEAIEAVRPKYDKDEFCMVMLFDISIQIVRAAKSN